jgi:hypothetical protein
LQGLANNHSQRFVGKVTIKGLVVNFDFAGAGPEINSGRCRFATPRSVILNISHNNLPLSPLNLTYELVL